MNLTVWCQTDVGLKREINQDSFLIDEDLGLYIVADGMGGHRGGEIASAMAVETIREVVGGRGQNYKSAGDLLGAAYREASSRIFNKSEREPEECQGMGTTLVTALRRNDSLYLGNVGDSRAYLFRAPYMWQLTEDHSLVNEQLRAGLLREEDLAGFGARNIITRSVGYEVEVQVDIFERPLQLGDVYLICSDGLTGLVSDEEIADILNTMAPPKVVKECIRRAKAGGGDDNITVMLIFVAES
jgi:protein phosphatase